MNNEQFEKLLQNKKDQSFHFEKSEEEFLADFLAATDRPAAHNFRFLRRAALFAVAAGAAIFIWFSMKPEEPVVSPEVDLMTETLRLFAGDDVAVLFVDNDLVIGERTSDEHPENLLKVSLDENIELKIACANNDSISINSSNVYGNVIVSQSDSQTLVLDIDLLIQGRHINTKIPVERGVTKVEKNGLHS